MKKKVLLLTTVAATTLTLVAAFVLAANTYSDGFAIQASNSDYTATINKSNMLVQTDSDSNTFGFQLHGGSEYGFAYLSDTTKYHTDITGTYSDYAFSWDADFSSTFAFRMDAPTDHYIVKGKDKVLRGFPSISKLEIVYANPQGGAFYMKDYAGWSGSETVIDESKSEKRLTLTPTGSQAALNEFGYVASPGYAMYIKSITFNYSC